MDGRRGGRGGPVGRGGFFKRSESERGDAPKRGGASKRGKGGEKPPKPPKHYMVLVNSDTNHAFLNIRSLTSETKCNPWCEGCPGIFGGSISGETPQAGLRREVIEESHKKIDLTPIVPGEMKVLIEDKGLGSYYLLHRAVIPNPEAKLTDDEKKNKAFQETTGDILPINLALLGGQSPAAVGAAILKEYNERFPERKIPEKAIEDFMRSETIIALKFAADYVSGKVEAAKEEAKAAEKEEAAAAAPAGGASMLIPPPAMGDPKI